jgi:Na+-translocating ferredoxin:NAD+ oxidoreductase RnfG subunit
VEEAQKICFPEANQFQSQKLSLSSAEKKRVENQSRVKVRRSAVQLWWARRGTNLLGVLFVDQVLGKHEWIDYALAVTPDGRVAHVEILEYREHYGGQVTNAPWRQQFRGKSAASPLKLNDDISNITGATLSCRHVTEGVKRLLATFEVVVRPHGPVGRGVPDAGPIAKP